MSMKWASRIELPSVLRKLSSVAEVRYRGAWGRRSAERSARLTESKQLLEDLCAYCEVLWLSKPSGVVDGEGWGWPAFVCEEYSACHR
jgi:hypothetical protein